MGTVILAARAVIALVFATAAVTKLRDPAAVRATFREFGTGERLASLAPALAFAELAVASGLLIQPAARWAAVAAALLLIVFIAGMTNALRAGRRPDCGCFGGLQPAPIGTSTLMRNGALVLIAILVVTGGPGPSIGSWVAAHPALEVLAVLAAVAAAAAAVMITGGSATADPAGSIASASPPALPTVTLAGHPAPDFRLTDLDGREWTLAQLRGEGRPVVLVFVNSTCGSCLTVFPDLARWQLTLAGSLSLILVGAGDSERMRQACEQHGITRGLLDSQAGVAASYGATGMPAAIAVTAGGVIASGPANGRAAIEDLIRLTLRRDSRSPRAVEPRVARAATQLR
ncbi:MAG: redoxin domain-containing protein [Actinomycetota bacterium]|nr:redoxin domain-containing protein [Actinomycetota bacterium]